MKVESPMVGIDVAKDYSFYAVVAPDGSSRGKPFELSNDPKGLADALQRLKKEEEALGAKPEIVLESTGHYSSRLVNFFTRHGFTVILVNPLQFHSIKASAIRKVKTDRIDCEELARLPFKLDNLTKYKPRSDELTNLQFLCRTMHHLSEQRVTILNQLVSVLDQAWPGLTSVFKNPASRTALCFLNTYVSPTAFLVAERAEVLNLFRSCSKCSWKAAEARYQEIYQIATADPAASIQSEALFTGISIYTELLIKFNDEIERLKQSIKDLSDTVPSVCLLKTIPGIGDNLAAMIAAEIGDVGNFKKAGQLAAYCGVDPSVRESGNFIGTKNRITKRGSPYVRRALYIAATVAIRKGSNGTCVNPVLRDYYERKTASKAKKQVLGAIMNKLVKIIFSVLKNQKPFILITPEEQKVLHNQKVSLAA